MAAAIRVQIKGIRQLRDRFDAIDDLGPLMRDIALSAIGEEKKLAPVKTGNLRRSIHVGHIAPRYAEVVASANYAAYVEFGTQPHEIRPRTKKVLRWKTKGGYRFARVVQHPGTRAQPYMIPGAQKALSDVGLRDRLIGRWNRAA
jgi:hypothetical protein